MDRPFPAAFSGFPAVWRARIFVLRHRESLWRAGVCAGRNGKGRESGTGRDGLKERGRESQAEKARPEKPDWGEKDRGTGPGDTGQARSLSTASEQAGHMPGKRAEDGWRMARGAGAAGRSRLTGRLPDGQWIKHGELAQEAGAGSRNGEHGGHADCEMRSSDAEASHPEQPDLRKRSEPQPGFASCRLRAIARRHDFREPEGGHACPERKQRTAARQKASSPAAAA